MSHHVIIPPSSILSFSPIQTPIARAPSELCAFKEPFLGGLPPIAETPLKFSNSKGSLSRRLLLIVETLQE